MGDKPTYNVSGDNSYFSGIAQGESNTVIASLNATGQQELAQALNTLMDAVWTSQHLSEDEKRDQLDVITEIGENAVVPKPNKAKLKRLCNGLLATLQAVPDISQAVMAVAPILNHLHL